MMELWKGVLYAALSALLTVVVYVCVLAVTLVVPILVVVWTLRSLEVID